MKYVVGTLAVAAACLFGSSIAQGDKCYYPSGDLATDYDYVPCGSDDTLFKSCCIPKEGDKCMANGLCSYPNHYYYRGACQSKDGSGCLDLCPGTKDKTWLMVRQCVEDEYCCESDKNHNCCNDEKSDRFTLEDYVASTTSAAPSATKAPSSTASAGSASATATPSHTAAADKDKNKDDSKGSSKSTPIGPIVGGVVGGVAAIAAAGIAIWYLRKRSQDKRVVATESEKGNPNGYYSTQTPHSEVTSPYGSPPPVEAQFAKSPVSLTSQPTGPSAPIPSAPVESDSRPLQRYEMAG